MKCKFLHLSDVHLGYQQYNHKERFNDFGRAFLHIVEQAISQRVDLVVLAGDLFQKRAIDPPTLIQAIEGLNMLKKVGIPVAAVEGNHERAHYRDVFSWMDFLADRGYLALLNPASFQEGVPVLTAWDGAEGAYLDVTPASDATGARLRIYGVKYYGASTPHLVEGLAKALADMDHQGIEYVIMIMHAGLEGVLPRYSATLTHDQLAPLRDYVDYLALGHIHKPFEREDWIYNPGSPETCGMDEVAWSERGYYLVEVDSAARSKAARACHVARLVANPRRPFLRLSVGVESYTSPEALYQAIETRLRDEAAAYNRLSSHSERFRPVVELGLDGVLPFHHYELDLKRLEALVTAAFDPLLVRVANRTVPTEYEVSGDESKPRAELEREVVEDLVERDTRYRSAAEDWADLILDVKRMVLERTSPQGIVEFLESRADLLTGD
jgi:exonuclease SbcD